MAKGLVTAAAARGPGARRKGTCGVLSGSGTWTLFFFFLAPACPGAPCDKLEFCTAWVFVGSLQTPCSRSRASESVQRCYASSKKKERNEKKTGGFGRWSCLRPAAFGTWRAPSRPRRSRPGSSPPKTASSRRSRGAGLSNLLDRTPIESLLPTRARAMNVTAKLQSDVCLRRGTYHIPSSPPTCSSRIAQGLRLPFILGTSLFWSCGVPLPYRSANNKTLSYLVRRRRQLGAMPNVPACNPARKNNLLFQEHIILLVVECRKRLLRLRGSEQEC